MTQIMAEDVTCGNCNKTSSQNILLSTNTFGGRPDLDLRPAEMKRSTMSTWIQYCPHCGLCAPSISHPPSTNVALNGETYQAALHDQRFPELARRFYAFAMLVEESRPANAAQAYLNVAWLCDDAKLLEMSREARNLSVRCTRRIQPFPNTEDGYTLGAQFVDVLRRAGHFDLAASNCDDILKHANLPDILKSLLEHQKRLIAARDIQAHRLEECIE